MWFLLIFSFFGALIFGLFCIARLSRGITRSNSCLIGKTAIITGANSGLGYQTTLNLAARGCRIIMADVADMEKSKQNVIKFTNNTNILTKKLDLSSLQSVREFAADIIKTEERLDILINNAGIVGSLENRTKDDLHPAMQINYFGHFLLTHLLIDLLKKSAPSRIIFTSSLLAFVNNLSLDNFNFDCSTSQMNKISREWLIYGNNKLAVIIASDIFAQKLKGTEVTSNCIHPGLVKTPIFTRTHTVMENCLHEMFFTCCNFFFAKDAWEGSQTLVHVAVSKKLQRETGKYFVDCKPFVKPRLAYDQQFCQEIWKASEKYVRLEEHEKL
ncbi:retinol dehydrogenase 12-like [Zophobas morio]|uniref:retinol dehydrogenase 12-like n=1 Tax=Zophobas morio TaxID=2755281 RepID=UPI0030835AAA